MPKIYNSMMELIGKTPLLRLNGFCRKFNIDCDVLAKLDYFNPAGSSKDRIAAEMIEEAERKGLIKEGATMVTRASEILGEYQYRCRGTLQEEEADTAQEAYYQYVLNKPPFPQKAPAVRRRVADATPVTFESSVSCPQNATPAAKQVFEALTDSPKTAEWLCATTGLPAGKVFAALTELELFGCVTS